MIKIIYFLNINSRVTQYTTLVLTLNIKYQIRYLDNVLYGGELSRDILN